MSSQDWEQASEEARQAWNANAAFWDERMGEGNDFQEVLVWPATDRLLALQPGERVLDVACGNGLTARRLAEEMIAHARARTTHHAERITYLVLDASDEAALLALGKASFDAALCNMALFDMADIQATPDSLLPESLIPDSLIPHS